MSSASKRQKKLAIKKTTLRLLTSHGIRYATTDNIGYQIRYQDCKVDFWPTVSKWRELPHGKTRYDINSLIEFVETSGMKEVCKKPLLAKPSFKLASGKTMTEAQHRQRKIMSHFGMHFD